MTRPSFIPTWAAAYIPAILLALFSLSAPVIAHEGHDHGATAKPADVRLAPRFEVRSEDVEIVGVLADRNLLIYVDRAIDNGPIQGAQIEVEGPGIKGVATAMGDGVYQIPAAALAQAGKYPLMLTIQAGEIVDLLTATLARAEQAAGEAGPLLVDARRLMVRLQAVGDKVDLLLGNPSPGGVGALAPRLDELGGELSVTSRQLNRLLQRLEEAPQSLVFGPPQTAPGPGEAGFVAPSKSEK